MFLILIPMAIGFGEGEYAKIVTIFILLIDITPHNGHKFIWPIFWQE